MAVSIETVTEVITRTCRALRDLKSDGVSNARALVLEAALSSYFVQGRFVQPDARWLMCDLCKMLGEAAGLLKRVGEESLAGQIQSLVLADALFAIATESHFAAYRHPDRERTAEMVKLSDEIRGAASRAGIPVTLTPPNCPTQQVGHAQIRARLNQRVSEASTGVGALRKIVATDPHCDQSLFGPVFDRVQEYLPSV